MAIRIDAGPTPISIVQVYALTGAASDEEIERFYSDLEDLLNSPPKERRASDSWEILMRKLGRQERTMVTTEWSEIMDSEQETNEAATDYSSSAQKRNSL